MSNFVEFKLTPKGDGVVTMPGEESESCLYCATPMDHEEPVEQGGLLSADEEEMCEHHTARYWLMFGTKGDVYELNGTGPYVVYRVHDYAHGDGRHQNTVLVCVHEALVKDSDTTLGEDPEVLRVDFNDNKHERYGLPTVAPFTRGGEQLDEETYLTDATLNPRKNLSE